SVVAISEILAHLQDVLANDDDLAECLTYDDWDTAEETDLVQLLYTSGTTSAPQGAMLTHRALLAHYNGTIRALHVSAKAIPLTATPLYHSAAMHVSPNPYVMLGGTVGFLRIPAIPGIL